MLFIQTPKAISSFIAKPAGHPSMTFNAVHTRCVEKSRKTYDKSKKSSTHKRKLIFNRCFVVNIKYPASPKKIKMNKAPVFSQLFRVIFCFGQKQTKEAFSLLSL